MSAVETDQAPAPPPTKEQQIAAAYAELDDIRAPLAHHRAEADKLHARRVELYVLLDGLGVPSGQIGQHIDGGAGSVRVALAKAKKEAAERAAKERAEARKK